MSSASTQDSHEFERWMPPDVGLGFASAARTPRAAPSAEEIASLEEDARRAGAEAGFREGYQAGYKEGCEKAAQEAEAERQEREAGAEAERLAHEEALQSSVAALEGIARALADPLANSADALEPELLALVEALARRVIMDELSLRPELAQNVLHEALAQLPSRNYAVRVHVHPDQQALLERWAETRGEDIAWIADESIEPGGCLLQSGPSRIDATLEARIRQGVDAIWGEVSRPCQDSDVIDDSDMPPDELQDEPQQHELVTAHASGAPEASAETEPGEVDHESPEPADFADVDPEEGP